MLPRFLCAIALAGAVLSGMAQCANDNSLLGSALSVTCPGSITGGCVQGGQYVLVNVTSGQVYTFSTCDASWNTQITLYNGSAASNLTYNDDACSNTRSAVQWTASYTGQVRVLVDRSNCGTNGTCAPLWITCGLNDDRCSSTLLAVGATCSNTVGTNVGATPTSGVGAPSCSTYSGGDVWFHFVPPADGRATISTSTIGGSSLTDAAMAVYSASACGSTFTQVACNDDSPFGGNMPYLSLSGLNPSATYWVRVWEEGNNAFGTFNICAISSPANDDPCGATGLTVGTSCTNITSTTLAASDSSVPSPSCGGYSGGDVWFSFVAPGSGQMTLTTSTVSGSQLTDAGMALYSATACGGTFTELACNDDPVSGGTMPIIAISGLTSGTTYYVRVWEYGNNRLGQFAICATTPAAAANDDPCAATVLGVGTTCTNTLSSTAGSTNTAGVGTPSCGSYTGNDVWFRVVAPTSGTLVLTTSAVPGSSLTNAAMAVYSAPTCGGTMTELACNDNSPSTNMPEIVVTGLTSGTSYYVRVWANTNTAFGQFNICAVEPPANDEPCGAISITVGSSCSLVSRTNVSSTYSSTAALPGCGSLNLGSLDVWFQFTAPASGVAIVESTSGTLTDGSMALYEGSSCAALTLVQCSSDEGMGAMPFLRFADLTPGSVYYLRYWGSGTATGTFNLCIWSPTVPSGSCAYFLELWDSGENGWGTSAVETQLNGGTVVSTTVAASDFYECHMIGVNSGDLFQVNYVATGGGQGQNRYQIRQIPSGRGVLRQGPSPASGMSLFEVIDCLPPDAPIEDCMGGRTICNSESFSNSTLDVGFDVDLSARNQGCLGSAEKRGTWYHFSPSSAGTLAFTITPAASVDYDFAVWGPTTSVVCRPDQQPVRCNYAYPSGATGLSTSASNTYEDGGSTERFCSALTVSAGEVYSIYISNYSDAQPSTAFTLTWQLTGGSSLDCSLLPAEFLGLEAELKGDAVEVQWSTGSETHTSHFTVQRSVDAVNYETIGTVQAMGHSTALTNYYFLDEKPMEGLNYYRVQQVDQDGTSVDSPTDYAIYRKGTTEMVVFPNPAGDILWASFAMDEEDAVIWRVLDAGGRVVEQDLYQGSKGNMLIDIPLDRLAAGSYSLLVNDARGRMNLSAHFLRH